jgi:hypothetical protein
MFIDLKQNYCEIVTSTFRLANKLAFQSNVHRQMLVLNQHVSVLLPLGERRYCSDTKASECTHAMPLLEPCNSSV